MKVKARDENIIESIKFTDPILEIDIFRVIENLKRQLESIPENFDLRGNEIKIINFLNQKNDVFINYIIDICDRLYISKKIQYIAINLFFRSIYKLAIQKHNFFIIAVTSLVISCTII